MTAADDRAADDHAAADNSAAADDRAAANSVLHSGAFVGATVGRDVEYRVVTPPGWSRAERLPLLLVLHGAASSAAVLETYQPMYERMWHAGDLPRLVAACVSVPTLGGFYLDAPPGSGGPAWEALVADEFPGLLAEVFGIDPDAILLMGASMGGLGVLNLAFRAPARYAAAAAVSPAIFPAETIGAVPAGNTPSVLADLLAAMGGGRGDERAFAANNPVNRLRANAAAIRDSGLAIFLACGGADQFRLQDGAEYLHRALSDLDVSHTYRIDARAEHVGPRAMALYQDALHFLSAELGVHL
jgi:S-formylglutathione hydrolase